MVSHSISRWGTKFWPFYRVGLLSSFGTWTLFCFLMVTVLAFFLLHCLAIHVQRTRARHTPHYTTPTPHTHSTHYTPHTLLHHTLHTLHSTHTPHYTTPTPHTHSTHTPHTTLHTHSTHYTTPTPHTHSTQEAMNQ